MSDIYDDLLKMTCATSSSADCSSDPLTTLDIARKIADITVPVFPAVEPSAIVPEVNILYGDNRHNYVYPITLPESRVLSNIFITTTTVSGTLENIDVDATHINKFNTSPRIIEIKSNFGHKIEPGTQVVKSSKSSKGYRKKKAKSSAAPKKERKRQGTGECFNSQITFVVKTDIMKEYPKGPDDTYLYKFKIFQKNKLQLPGALPQHLMSIEIAILDVIDCLNEGLGVTDTPAEVKLISLTPQLKNYKFYIRLAPRNIINLSAMKEILLMEKIENGTAPIDKMCKCNELTCNSCFYKKIRLEKDYRATKLDQKPSVVLTIADINYTLEDTKLSILFKTPIPGNPNKIARVNIYSGSKISNYTDMIKEDYGAKVNILGGYDTEHTKNIYYYIEWLVEAYRPYIVVDLDGLLVDDDDDRIDANSVYNKGKLDVDDVEEINRVAQDILML